VGAVSNPGTGDVGPDPDRKGDVGRGDGDPGGRIGWDRPLKLIGFSCRMCGFARPAGNARRFFRHCAPAPRPG